MQDNKKNSHNYLVPTLSFVHFISFPVSQMSHGSESTASYVDGATTANITQLDKATPPLTGTFSAGIYGSVAEGRTSDNLLFSLCAQSCSFNAKLETSSD